MSTKRVGTGAGAGAARKKRTASGGRGAKPAKRGAQNATREAAVRLEGRLGIATVGDVHGRITRATRVDALEGDALGIDAGGVDALDASVVQLLVVHSRELAARGARIDWIAVSDPVRDAARSLGLVDDLGLPAAS